MTLLDAPKFDAARDQRNRFLLIGGCGLLLVLLVAWWLVAGRPVDWPWNWNGYLFGRSTANKFLAAIEKDDMAGAYGIWIHDQNWQQHPDKTGSYPFARFQQDWSSTSPDNEYGPIKSHQIAEAARYGNGVLLAILINGRKSKALTLDYDPRNHTLDFAPPGVELYLGP